MKKLIFPIFFVLLGGAIQAQVMVGKTDINSRYIQYVEIWDKPIKASDKAMAMVDFGQNSPEDSKDKTGAWAITNRTGQAMEFNGVVDILNYMYRNGWEVMSSKSIDGYESYFMKRRAGYVMPTNGISKN